MDMYQTQQDWDIFNQNMSKIFNTEYQQTEISNIAITLNKSFHEPWNKGKIMDQDYCDAHRVEITPEKYKKLIDNLDKNRHKLYTEERNRKISESLIGKSLSEETKQKISKTKTGKRLTVEHKQKITDSLLGKPSRFSGHIHSQETKQKMSNAVRPPPWNKGLTGYKKQKSSA